MGHYLITHIDMSSLDKARALTVAIRQITLTHTLELHSDNSIFIGFMYNEFKDLYVVVYDDRLEDELHVKAALLDLMLDYTKQFHPSRDLVIMRQSDFRISESELAKSYFKTNSKAYPTERLESNFKRMLEIYKRDIHPKMEG